MPVAIGPLNMTTPSSQFPNFRIFIYSRPPQSRGASHSSHLRNSCNHQTVNASDTTKIVAHSATPVNNLIATFTFIPPSR